MVVFSWSVKSELSLLGYWSFSTKMIRTEYHRKYLTDTLWRLSSLKRVLAKSKTRHFWLVEIWLPANQKWNDIHHRDEIEYLRARQGSRARWILRDRDNLCFLSSARWYMIDVIICKCLPSAAEWYARHSDISSPTGAVQCYISCCVFTRLLLAIWECGCSVVISFWATSSTASPPPSFYSSPPPST